MRGGRRAGGEVAGGGFGTGAASAAPPTKKTRCGEAGVAEMNAATTIPTPSAAEVSAVVVDPKERELPETERLLRMRRAAESKAAGGDSWRRALDMRQEQADAAVVLRVHRRCGSGAAVLPKVLCLGSIFDHSGHARAEVRSPAAAKHAMTTSVHV